MKKESFIINNSGSEIEAIVGDDSMNTAESGDSDIEYNKMRMITLVQKHLNSRLYIINSHNKKPINAGKLVLEENFLQNSYFNIIKKCIQERSVIYAVIPKYGK